MIYEKYILVIITSITYTIIYSAGGSQLVGCMSVVNSSIKLIHKNTTQRQSTNDPDYIKYKFTCNEDKHGL